jgi:hypothetical protein
MEMIGNLFPKFVFECKEKFDKFIHQILLSGIKYSAPNQFD